MKKRKGVTLTTLVFTVIILLMTFSTISVSLYYSINNAKKMVFANEIYNIENIIKDKKEKEENYVRKFRKRKNRSNRCRRL
ncbi:MAG: hypothetical protein PHR25_02460 [Clostridia bacterium]|nr:hypothetical protein [Clostridia bacterium]MDD4375622.1 hypothetical protein [Clostridia bacterium]